MLLKEATIATLVLTLTACATGGYTLKGDSQGGNFHIGPKKTVNNTTIYQTTLSDPDREQQLKEKIKELENALATQTGITEQEREQAQKALKKGNAKLAIALYTPLDEQGDVTLSEQTEKQRDIKISLGNAYYIDSQFKRALEKYDQAITLDPEYVATYNNRGIVYLLQNNYPQAIADFDQAIALDSEASKAYNNRGIAYILQNNYPQAIGDSRSGSGHRTRSGICGCLLQPG